jgi:hypothetical protein
MTALKIAIRLGLALFTGWYAGMLVLWVVSAVTGLSTWGLAHTGAPLILWPVFSIAIFWLLGRVPPFKASEATAAKTPAPRYNDSRAPNDAQPRHAADSYQRAPPTGPCR